MADPKGKRVLITGGAQGIGLCTAQEFANAGAELIITDVNEAALEDAATSLRQTGATVHARVCDVSDRAQVDEIAAWIINDLGGLDILINNAGIGHNGELAETALDTWKKLVDVNLWGPLYHIYAFLPHLEERGGGQIVNISSGQAFFRLPTWGAYTTVKTALGVFSEILHYEVRKRNIRVTTVYPFLVNTGFYDGVEGETLSAKLSMKLLPLYSMKPESVGKIILRATRREKNVEMVNLLNDLGSFARAVPLVPGAVGLLTNWLLAKKEGGTTA